MKKLFLVGALALFGAMSAQQQAIKVNPFSLLGGTDLVSYERAIGEKSSLGVGAGYGGYKISGSKYSSFGGSVFYRYYFDEAIKGWYAGANAGYLSGKVKLDTSVISSILGETSSQQETNYGAFNIGAKAGYQFIWSSGFTLDLNAGAGYTNFNYKDNSGDFGTLKASGVLPSFGVALGYAF